MILVEDAVALPISCILQPLCYFRRSRKIDTRHFVKFNVFELDETKGRLRPMTAEPHFRGIMIIGLALG